MGSIRCRGKGSPIASVSKSKAALGNAGKFVQKEVFLFGMYIVQTRAEASRTELNNAEPRVPCMVGHSVHLKLMLSVNVELGLSLLRAFVHNVGRNGFVRYEVYGIISVDAGNYDEGFAGLIPADVEIQC